MLHRRFTNPRPGRLAVMLLAALLTGGSVMAQEPTKSGDPGANPPQQPGVVVIEPQMVVTATRTPTEAERVGSAITILDEDLIQRQQTTMVNDVLRQVPGLDVLRLGGAGQITSIGIRGANPNHTLLLIDGIEANDPSAYGGRPAFAHLTVDNIERIEVLRGPQSGLWGSDAIGGVVNVITKRGQGPPKLTVGIEAGSFSTFREWGNLSGGNDKFYYAVNLSRLDSSGISAADRHLGNTEKDGYANTTLSTRFGFTPTDQFDIDFVLRLIDATADLDQDGGPPGSFTGDQFGRRLDSTEIYFKAEPRLVLADGNWEQRFKIAFADFSHFDNMGFTPRFNGHKLTLDWQHNLFFIPDHVVTLGGAHQYEAYDDSSTPEQTAHLSSFYFQDQVNLLEDLYVTAGGRFDYHNEFGSEFTWRIAPAYVIRRTGTRLHASYGTGFRAPSLPELYGPFGNPALQPERSRGWDAGVEQTLFEGDLIVDVTYFDNRFKSLVGGFPIDNIGRARARGVEVALAWQLADNLSLRTSYTHQHTQDDQDQRLLRRAEHKFAADLSYDITAKANLTLTAAYVSDRDDFDPLTFGRTRSDRYTLINLAGHYDVTEKLRLFARVENLLDEQYQPVAGFGAPGVAAFGGVRLTF